MSTELPDSHDSSPATEPLALKSNLGLGAGAEARCMCKDRALSACPGEWEPGCDLGNNPAHVLVRNLSADERAVLERALRRSVTVIDGGKLKAPN